MQEIELKFQVDPARRREVARAVATRSAQTTRLQAIYFDTPGRHLARAGVALRLRKEGRQWVQTLKAGGVDAMHRAEHNVTLAPGSAVALDVARHAGTPAAGRLAAALAEAGEGALPLERFRTNVRRVHRVLRARGATIELAFDHGKLQAGERTHPICELELELLRGSPRALIEVARRWARRHGLWLDVRSKAELGDRLARGLAVPPARKAEASPLARGMDYDVAWRAAIRTCLAQMLPNASDIAGASYGDDQVHQLRVGLRRLRSLLRFLDAGTLQLDAATLDTAAELFRRLGGTRDRDVLEATLWPALQAAGAPSVALPDPADAARPDAALRQPAATELWLSLLSAASEESPAPAAPGQAPAEPGAAPPPGPSLAVPAAREPWAVAASARTAAAPAADSSGSPDRPAPAEPPMPNLRHHSARRLKRWHRRIAGEAEGFLQLSDEARHGLRKRVKRLRYAAEFIAPLFSRRRVERYLARLRPLQECLGEFNDLHVAQSAYLRLAGDDGRAWFAVGWIAAQRDSVLQRCQAALQKFARAEPFWRER